MNRAPLTSSACLLLLALAACRSPVVGGSYGLERYDAETFFETTSIFGGSFSHDDERLLVSSDRSGVFNAYSVDLESGRWTQLTNSTTNATYAASYFPHDDRILVSADEGGNERSHVFVVTPDGEQLDLTPGEDVKASFAGWHADERSFFLLSNARDSRMFDVLQVKVPSGPVEASAGASPRFETSVLFQNPGGVEVSEISDDGRYVALVKNNSNADSDVYLWDARNPEQEPRHLTPHEGLVVFGAQTFTPDNETLYLSSNQGSEFTRVLAYDVEEGTTAPVIEADWDVSFVIFSDDGRYRVHGVNADARSVVTVLDTSTGKELDLPDFPGGDIGQVRFSDDGETITFYVNGDTSPSNLYVYDVSEGTARRLSDTLSASIDESDLVVSQVVRYPSFDDLPIPALLYRPNDATAEHPAPAVVYVHGGPGGQSRTGYNPVIQHLVNHGYAVLAVNNRGSSGYGKTFNHLDDKRHGDVDLKDCVYARRYLETLDWVDGEKVAIMGGSYGGYMVAAALAFEPEVFDAGIDIFGVTNFLRTLQEIPDWWEDFRVALYAEMGDPATDAERLRAMSPIFHASNIEKPLLVVQGANDPRVKQVESDELVEAVRANEVPVEYLLFPDEGHGFRNKKNRIAAQEAYLEFLNTYLR